jgi:hypothetical protein
VSIPDEGEIEEDWEQRKKARAEAAVKGAAA